jgi:AmiR/NasT family two-component response regulator
MNRQNVLLIEDSHHDTVLVQDLNKAGFQVLKIQFSEQLLQQVQQTAPDILVLNFASIPEQSLAILKALSQKHPLPTILFTTLQAGDDIGNIVNSGVNSLIVDGFQGRNLTAIVAAAVARFQQLQSLAKSLGLLVIGMTMLLEGLWKKNQEKWK